MEADFYRHSLQISDMVIDMTLERGCRIFEERDKQAQIFANKDHCLIVSTLVKNQLAKPDCSKQMYDDNEPKSINRDNMVALVAKVDRRCHNANKTVANWRNDRRGFRIISQLKSHEKQPSSRKKYSIRNYTRTGNQTDKFVSLNPQLRSAATDLQLIDWEDRYRFRQESVQASNKRQQKAEELRKKEQLVQIQKLKKQKEELSNKGLIYTFDFDGKLMLCQATNKKKQLAAEDIPITIKAQVKELIQAEKNSSNTSDINELTKQPTKNDISTSIIDKSKMSRLQTRQTPQEISINYRLNEQYNNNNMRQVNSIPIMQLMDGVRLGQSHNSAEWHGGDNRKPFLMLNKKQFIQKIENRRFLRHDIKLSKSRVQRSIDIRHNTVSALAGDIRRRMTESDEEEYRSKLTNSTVMNKIHYRQNLVLNQSDTTAPINQSSTSQEFFNKSVHRKRGITTADVANKRDRRQDRIQVEQQMVSVLLD